MTPYCWVEVSDTLELGPKIIDETTAKIKKILERLKAANERTIAHVNKRRRDLEFEVGDNVWLKVAPTKGTVRFGRRTKLAPIYITPYEILDRVGKVAY
uniref:hypothetical protein n=1 Tax=Escherichia coli TaxID=562 RepID=UPI00200D6155